MHGNELFDYSLAFGEGCLDLLAAGGSGLFDLLQTDRLSREFWANRPTKKAVLREHADLGHVRRVIADQDLLFDIIGKPRIDIAVSLKADPILLHATGLGHGQEQQVELLLRIRHAGQKPTSFPSLLWHAFCFTVDPVMIVRKQPGPKVLFKRW